MVRLLCESFGLFNGLVKGARGASATKSGLAAALQPLNTVKYEHFRRLEGQLGTLTLELTASRAPLWLGGGNAGVVVSYLSELLAQILPEEDAFAGLFGRTVRLLDAELAAHGWRALVAYELFLLENLGYGLRLRPEEAVFCENNSPLAYVSPASGRAVPVQVARGYEARLLPLPACLGGQECTEYQNVTQALTLTGYFLQKALHGKQLQSRARMQESYLKGLNPHDLLQAA